MPTPILVLNAGSSSLKFSLFDADAGLEEPRLRGRVTGIGTSTRLHVETGGRQVLEDAVLHAGAASHEQALAAVLERCRTRLGEVPLAAVGHRVVHGGVRHAAPVRLDDSVIADLETLVPLAPLHQPHHLAAIRTLRRQEPGLPQVACFDTAFHRSQPELAQQFALPRRWTEAGIIRYGFHGLSYESIAGQLATLAPPAHGGRTIVAHLGNGVSLCAMRDGRSVASTMSFTPADGAMMGTRCGSLDPGVVLHWIRHHGLSPAQVQHLIFEESGLLGVSGISSDVRVLLESAEPAAARALDLFVYRICRELGSLAAALGGVETLVFTAGIGENAPTIRQRICEESRWLGIQVDPEANSAGRQQIHSERSRVAVWVLPTDEEAIIARHTVRTLGILNTVN